MLRALRSPWAIVRKLILFLVFTLFFYMSQSGGVYYYVRSGTQDFQFISMRKTAAKFIWPDIEYELDLPESRKLKWKREVNKSQSEPQHQRFPDVFVVGAERCGGGALTNLLLLHPLIKPTDPLDTQFFMKYYNEGKEFYENMMPAASERELILESAESVFSLSAMETPQRIKNLSPKAKVIVVLCNPADRVLLDFNAELQNNMNIHGKRYQLFLGTYLNKVERITKEIQYDYDAQMQAKIYENVQNDYANHIMLSGLYYYYAIRWNEAFGPAAVKYLSRYDVLRNTGAVMTELQEFLQLPYLIHKDDFVFDKAADSFCFYPSWNPEILSPAKKCPTEEDSKISTFQPPTCLQSLKKFYHPHNEKLYDLLRRNFTW